MKKVVLLSIVLSICNFLSACAMQPDKSYRQEIAKKDSARAHAELAQGYYSQGQMGIALEEFNAAIKSYPDYAEAYNGLGLVHAALGEDFKAETNFKKALSLSPNSSETQNNYGGFLCSRGRYDESIPYFLEAVKNPLYPSPEAAYLNAGICSLGKKDIKNAKSYFEKSYQIEPLTHRAAYELARMNFEEGNPQLARRYLQNSILTSPTAPMLWLGVLIERALGDKNAQASYELQLKKNYPESAETKALLSGK